MEQDNRESWLNRVAAGIAPLFNQSVPLGGDRTDPHVSRAGA